MDPDMLLPRAEDVAFYRRHGYWISPVILPSELLDAAERGMRRFYAADHDTVLPDVPATRGRTPKPGEMRKNDYASLRVRELADLVAYPIIGAIAAVLAGAKSILLWHDQLLYKPVDTAGTPTRVGWHTDRQYWMSCSSEEMLTAWVGFHDVSEVNGGIAFLPGSHRWDVQHLDFFAQDVTTLEAEIGRQGYPVRPVIPSMRRCQVSFHHCRTVHGSARNRGTEARRSLAIHLQPGDNHWRERRSPDGTPARHPNEDLVRTVAGVPDYADPTVCPELWPR
jgi:ectoine hydroxylase-related dioxygenase (phytanoyl-CoA dioxygenase family)